MWEPMRIFFITRSIEGWSVHHTTYDAAWLAGVHYATYTWLAKHTWLAAHNAQLAQRTRCSWRTPVTHRTAELATSARCSARCRIRSLSLLLRRRSATHPLLKPLAFVTSQSKAVVSAVLPGAKRQVDAWAAAAAAATAVGCRCTA